MARKFILLDVDGVLNNRDTQERTPEGNRGVDDRFLENLKIVINKTEASVVLSSDWKLEYHRDGSHGADMLYLIERLKEFGLEISDVTYCLDDKARHIPETRSEEIYYWHRKNHIHRSDRWCVLDDHYIHDHKKIGIPQHLIITQTPGSEKIGGYTIPDKGFNEKLADQAIEILSH